MKDFILSLPEFVIFGLLGLVVLVSILVGWWVKGFFLARDFRKKQVHYRDEQETVHRQMKKLWDSELDQLKGEKGVLIAKVELMEERLEDYRRKISGLGMLSFLGSKRRADILYALLLENEALESLINAQTQKMADVHQQHLREKLMDVRKRQRLISEIFNDQKIKEYVEDVITGKEDSSDEGSRGVANTDNELIEGTSSSSDRSISKK